MQPLQPRRPSCPRSVFLQSHLCMVHDRVLAFLFCEGTVPSTEKSAKNSKSFYSMICRPRSLCRNRAKGGLQTEFCTLLVLWFDVGNVTKTGD